MQSDNANDGRIDLLVDNPCVPAGQVGIIFHRASIIPYVEDGVETLTSGLTMTVEQAEQIAMEIVFLCRLMRKREAINSLGGGGNEG